MGGRKRTWEAVSFEFVMTVIALIALIVIIAPSLVVMIVSFTSGFSLKFPPPGYSLRWYAELMDAWQLHFAAKNSLDRRAVDDGPFHRARRRGGARNRAISDTVDRACSIHCSCRRWCCRRWPSVSRR